MKTPEDSHDQATTSRETDAMRAPHATHTLNSDSIAVISLDTQWIPIDEHTPRGAKLQLISKKYGVAQYGIHMPGDMYFTHWYPMPSFKKP